ncbi:hypothetical protein BCE02nite_57570 [Brevibacillus centrosporus]|nr:hypothetical protein BCE02nite_57570 [Brevibacillus centrosporus]
MVDSWVPAVHIPAEASYMQIRAYMLSLRDRIDSEIWTVEGRMAGSSSHPEMPSVSPGRV